MKFPKEVNTYCPHCRAHSEHRAKLMSKGKARTLAQGNLAHERSLKGHGGKRAGQKTVKKQGKNQRLMLTCSKCKKKQQRVLRGRTKKKTELR